SGETPGQLQPMLLGETVETPRRTPTRRIKPWIGHPDKLPESCLYRFRFPHLDPPTPGHIAKCMIASKLYEHNQLYFFNKSIEGGGITVSILLLHTNSK